jgi:hypothetical protein
LLGDWGGEPKKYLDFLARGFMIRIIKKSGRRGREGCERRENAN